MSHGSEYLLEFSITRKVADFRNEMAYLIYLTIIKIYVIPMCTLCQLHISLEVVFLVEKSKGFEFAKNVSSNLIFAILGNLAKLKVGLSNSQE